MTDTLTTRIATLPVWAQHHIAQLSKEKRELEQRIATLFGTSPTDTWWGEGMDGDHYLPTGARVEFQLLGKTRESLKVAVRIEHGHLDINANASIVVVPGAANHIVVQAREE